MLFLYAGLASGKHAIQFVLEHSSLFFLKKKEEFRSPH